MKTFANHHFIGFRKAAAIVLSISFLTNSCDIKMRKSQDHPELVAGIRETATRMLDDGEAGKGLAYFDSAYKQIENPGIGDEVIRLSFKGDNYYRSTGKFVQAVESLDSIFVLLSSEELKKKYIRQYITAMFVRGDILFELQRYDEAYESYSQGKIRAENILDKCSLSEYEYRLGMVSYKQAKFAEAASNFRMCFLNSLVCPDDFKHFALGQEVLSNVSLSYSKIDKIDSALAYSNKALAFISANAKKYPDRQKYISMAKGVIYGNQGNLYVKLKNESSAEKLFLRSIEINIQKGYDNNDAQLTLLKLGEMYLASGQLPKAFQVAERVKLSLTSTKNPKVDFGLNKLYWEYFERAGRSGEAYVFLKRFTELKDSLNVINEKLVKADLNKEFERIDQRAKYKLLSQANENKKILLYIFILFSVMTLIILFLLWKNWNASRKNISTLEYLNKQVTYQNGQLENTLIDLKNSSAEKDKILKVVAHDLRNPIGAIANISTILLDEIEFSGTHQKMVELIKEASYQSIEMINELLTASANNGPSEMKFERMDVSNLIYKCVDQLRFKAEQKQQYIKVDVKAGVKIVADHEKLGRVISNIIINSIKFSPLNTTIQVRLEEGIKELDIVVEDQGIGIPKDIQASVFDMFGDSKRKGTSGEQTFGIGLPFSKQIAESHGGRIWFETNASGGTTFHIVLPLEQLKHNAIVERAIGA